MRRRFSQHCGAQPALVALLISALLVTSMPFNLRAATPRTPAPHPVALRTGAGAPATVTKRQGAMGPELRAGKNSNAAHAVSAAEDPPLDFCDVYVPRNGPEWSDRQGWAFAPNYLNIKLADIDGDGQAELLGRAGGGIKVFGWDKQNNRWKARADGPPLGNDPYGQPQYYETLQFANVDEAKGDELLIRSPQGMLAYHYNEDKDTWTLLTPIVDSSAQCTANKLALSDACGFNLPQYYQTIQTADLDKNGRAELLARAGDGVYVYQLDATAGTWQETGGVLSLPDSKNYNQPQYYRTIQTGDLDGDGAPELLVRAADGVHTYKWNAGNWSEPYSPLALLSPAWDSPQNYLTIQTANLDGKAGAELLARSENGLLFYQLNTATKGWEGPVSTLGLSDAFGWNQPQYYQTIQTADLDGDKRDEVIARASDGLRVYKFTTFWEGPLAIFGLMNDGADWDQPSSYLTLQTGDVDGNGRAEIIGRSHNELETVHYNAERGLYQKQMTLMFPAFTGSQQDVYKYIGNYVLDGGVDSDDFRKSYDDETNLQANQTRFISLKPNRPANFTEADWNAVINQIDTELDYAVRITTLFSFQSEVINSISTLNGNSIDTISASLAMQNETFGAEIASAVVSFIVGVAAVIPGFGEIPEAAKAAIELTATIIENSVETANEFNDRKGADEEFKGAVKDLKTALGDRLVDAKKSLSCQEDSILQDWELLQAMGEAMRKGNIQWKDTYEAYLLEAGKPAFELEVWKALVPARWEIYRIFDINGGLPDDYVQLNGYRDDGQPLVVCGAGADQCWRHTHVFVIQGRGWHYPTQETFSELFDPPPTGLGVDRLDLFLRRNGWRIPYEVNARPPRPDGTPNCHTRCFRSPEYYYQQAGRLPQGAVFIAGSFFNKQINTSNVDAMRRVLRPGNGIGTPTPLDEFNRQYVAMQLNLMVGGTLTADQLDTSLTCYQAKLARTTLSDGVMLTSSVPLRTVLTEARLAAQRNRAADFTSLADALADLNGNDPYGRCSTIYSPPR